VSRSGTNKWKGQIESGEETLAANLRVRAQSERLRAETSAVISTYPSHRLPQLAGGSDAREADGVRRLLRGFVSGPQPPKSYAGPSSDSVCEAWGSVIKPNDIEYDVVIGTTELRLDLPCHRILIHETVRAGQAHQKSA
jgi:hypothetical protein